jgi:hypothetical protein
MLVLGLPDEARIFTTPEIRQALREARQWTLDHELLAQIKEEVSILAAEHRRKKPVDVPRPDHVRRNRRRKPVKAGEPNPEGFRHAVSVLQRNAKRVQVS